MAHLWMTGESGRWAVVPLEGETFSIDTLPPSPLPGPTEERGAGGAREQWESGTSALLRRDRGSDRETWALITRAPEKVRVNGLPVSLGVRILTDRDAIRISEVGSCYFSTERLAQVEAFPGAAEAVFCPRCRQEIVKGTPAVRCPGPDCRVWHHQSDEFPCWTYNETCALCPQPTDLDAGHQWTPEGL
jgi:hypothetical protein